jgi:hypothetical protein
MRTIPLLSALVLAGAAAGCVVAPARGGGEYIAPAGVVYVAPTYASPGEGYRWEYHPTYGWGWRHPERGWHKGWN